MSRILFWTDPHNSDTPPRSREDTYCEDLLAKQKEVAAMADRYDLVICGGDVFHQKRSDRISFKLVNRLCELFREMGEVVIVPGNHDVETKWDFTVRPLGVFSHLPNVRISHAEIIEYDDFMLLTYGGAEFFPEAEFMEWLGEAHVNTIRDGKSKAKIGVFHQPIMAPEWDAMSFPFPMISPARILRCVDLAFIGHIHSRTYCDGRLCIPGALSRGTLSWDEVEREIYVASSSVGEEYVEETLITTTLESIEHKPGEDVFKIEEKVRKTKEDGSVATFLEFIDTLALPKTLSLEDAVAAIQDRKDVDKGVRDKAVQILRSL